MNTSEYLLKEYEVLTDRYATASRHLKELLRPISALPADEGPDSKMEKHTEPEIRELPLNLLNGKFAVLRTRRNQQNSK